MPHAVTHVILPPVIAALFRDFYLKKHDKKKFPLHYVLIVGIAGLLPDIDIAAYWILSFFGYSMNEVHRTFSHTIFFPIIFVLLSLIFIKSKPFKVRRQTLRWPFIFLAIAFGSFFHLVLDSLFAGFIRPLYPFSQIAFGLNLTSYLPGPLADIFFPSLDAAILVFWLIYLEVRHKISDFI